MRFLPTAHIFTSARIALHDLSAGALKIEEFGKRLRLLALRAIAKARRFLRHWTTYLDRRERAGRYPGLWSVTALSLTDTLNDVADRYHGDCPSRVSAFHAAAHRQNLPGNRADAKQNSPMVP